MLVICCLTTGTPSSKYEHQETSALLRNIRNISICMGKKIVSVTQENERISIKNSLSCLKCVLRLFCVVHGPIFRAWATCGLTRVINAKIVEDEAICNPQRILVEDFFLLVIRPPRAYFNSGALAREPRPRSTMGK